MIKYIIITATGSRHEITTDYFKVLPEGIAFFSRNRRNLIEDKMTGFVSHQNLDFIYEQPKGGDNEKDNVSGIWSQDE